MDIEKEILNLQKQINELKRKKVSERPFFASIKEVRIKNTESDYINDNNEDIYNNHNPYVKQIIIMDVNLLDENFNELIVDTLTNKPLTIKNVVFIEPMGILDNLSYTYGTRVLRNDKGTEQVYPNAFKRTGGINPIDGSNSSTPINQIGNSQHYHTINHTHLSNDIVTLLVDSAKYFNTPRFFDELNNDYTNRKQYALVIPTYTNGIITYVAVGLFDFPPIQLKTMGLIDA